MSIEVRDGKGATQLIETADVGGEHRYVQKIGDITLPSALLHGEKLVTAAATPEALAASTTIKSMVHVRAKPSNTDAVYIGNSAGVTTADGYPLDPGESLPIEIDDLAKVFIRVAVNGEGVNYIAS